MSNTELNASIQILKEFNLDSEDENSTASLNKIFDKSMNLQEMIENTNLSSNDKILQEAINMCIKTLEKCTVMVNHLELFSSNETIEEIQTSSIKYLILPALLGNLNLNLQTKELSQRRDCVRIAEVYFKDFLLRCKNYELCETTLKYFSDDLECSEEISDPSAIRQRKIEQYKLKKELEGKEKQLKIALGRPESEEYIREYYMVLLEKWIMIAVEEIENIKREKEILKKAPTKENSSKNQSTEISKELKPLKPIIITKNEVQKRVFGMGYPSLPVMTIDDFYYQRFHKQIQEQKTQTSMTSLQDKALRGEDLNKDAEDIEKELLLDKDDPATLMKARQWDEWKDDNPRGSGNRKNKG